jgi:hypothetical protein
MFKFAASSLAIALALSSFGAHAADVSTKAADSIPTLKLTETFADNNTSASNAASTLNNVTDLTADHQVTIVQSPTTCGGVPAPRMVPSDGYSTLCVNGILRFINDSENYTYSLKVSKTVNGKQEVLDDLSMVGPIGRPLTFKTAQELQYVKSASVEKDAQTGDDKTSLEAGTVDTGIFVILDPQGKLKDGTVIMDVDFDYSELLDIKNITTSDGLSIQSPDIRVTSQRSVVKLSPGKTLKLVGLRMSDDGKTEEHVEVDLTAKAQTK